MSTPNPLSTISAADAAQAALEWAQRIGHNPSAAAVRLLADRTRFFTRPTLRTTYAEILPGGGLHVRWVDLVITRVGREQGTALNRVGDKLRRQTGRVQVLTKVDDQ